MPMKLKEYLDKTETSMASFARLVGISPAAVEWYCRDEKIPRYAVMRSIFALTDGLVGPNDFYDIATDPPRLAA